MKECFSLIRYSSLKQSDGNSETRQLEIAPRVAKQRAWKFREDLSLQGLGLSAYHGDNLKIIRSIIDNAKSGIIAQGTVCIIEALDRFSRLPVDTSYQLLREVLLAGVEIYTDNNQRYLTKADLNNPMSIMMTVVELDAAFQYSDKLAFRVGNAWKEKRERVSNGTEKLTKMTVAWIDGNTWKPIPEKVKVIKRIYKMYAEGYGISNIVKTFNQEKLPVLGDGKSWNTGYIHSILKSRAVIGEFQQHKTYRVEGQKSYRREKFGMPIEGYYPAIIDKDLFYTVQAKFGKGKEYRKSSEIRNLFAGVAYCECGEKMYLAGGKNGNYYYYCRGSITNSTCKAPSIPYQPIENIFLAMVATNIDKILPDDKQDNTRLIELRGMMEDKRQQVSNITDFVIQGKATKALVEKQAQLEGELEAIGIELQAAEVKANAKTVKPSIDLTTVTLQQLKDNQNVRRFVRDFIQTHVGIIEFSLDRKNVNFGFRNDNHAKMLTETMKDIKTKNLTPA